MEVSKLVVDEKVAMDELPHNILKAIASAPRRYWDTTTYKASKALSISCNASREETSRALKKLIRNGAITRVPKTGKVREKNCKLYINDSYYALPSDIKEKLHAKSEEVIEERKEEEKTPEPVVVPVETTLDGQTITINLTINLRR